VSEEYDPADERCFCHGYDVDCCPCVNGDEPWPDVRPALAKDTVEYASHFKAFMAHCAEGAADTSRAHRKTFWRSVMCPCPVEGFPRVVQVEGPAAAHLCGMVAVVVALEGHPQWGRAWVEIKGHELDRYGLENLQLALASAHEDMAHIEYAPEGDE
jgi:hypothetical protein